jgi:ribose transport system ATP-binding protein
MSREGAPLVELRDVSKSFGATRALDGVSFAVHRGEIHVLAGENGAGKSTLIRVLSGVITDYQGDLLVNGERARMRGVRDAARLGIATIHQELSLVGSMTVAENLALPRGGGLFGWLRAADDERAARKILADMELDVEPTALVETLPLAAQQLLEIARALSQDARVLILDEPTSALSEPEAERLLARVEKLAQAGRGVVYISHRMEENDRLAHWITVLRDGRVVASRPAKELPPEALVALMMGRDKEEAEAAEKAREGKSRAEKAANKEGAEAAEKTREGKSQAEKAADADDLESATSAAGADRAGGEPETVLRVRDLRLVAPGVPRLNGVDFSVRGGEIVGLAGLRGSGASEALAAIFGVFGGMAHGEIELCGAPFAIESPARSIERGVLFLANDRKKTVLYDLDLVENITLSSLPRLAPGGVLRLDREARVSAEGTTRLRVAAPSLRAPARALSGGNQQKVALLRCVTAGPRVLLLDEPTRGVDVGAKADIHRTLRSLAASGMGIAVVASELPELLDLCDRIAVLWRGRVTKVLDRKNLSREQLRLALDAAELLPSDAAPAAPP